MKIDKVKIRDSIKNNIKIPDIKLDNIHIPPVLKKNWVQTALVSVVSYSFGHFRGNRPSHSTSTVKETVSFTTTTTLATITAKKK